MGEGGVEGKMQVFRQTSQAGSALIGAGVRVMLLSAAPDGLAEALMRMGAQVEAQAEVYEALSAILEDPGDYGLFVMECDGFGGLEAGMQALALLSPLQQPVPSILISRDCAAQEFPEAAAAPVLLRMPVSPLSLKVGLEHALRARLMWLHA